MQARAVIVGGGVVGCSVAYHLAQLGWRDVVLLEQSQLTSGTTWHAAGLIAQLRATHTMTRLAKYSQELYTELEAQTGVATGFRRCGSITLALTPERTQELARQAAMAQAFGVEVESISAAEVGQRYPLVNTNDITHALYLPKDGQADPANITMALASGARDLGVQIFEGVKVTGIQQADGRVSGVGWVKPDPDTPVAANASGNIAQQISSEHQERGSIVAEVVVNCAGLWGRELGQLAGVNVPLQACEHYYVLTQPIPKLTKLPVLRVPDEHTYYKEDAGKLLIGFFEPNAKPWATQGVPANFSFGQLPVDLEHITPLLELSLGRLPVLANTGLQTFFNGPESFTPDDAYHLGEAPGLRRFYVAAGFNSIGIQSAGGAGMALAQWIQDDAPPFDLGDVNIARMQPFQNNAKYLATRAEETLGLLYADHFPHRQKATARGIRRSSFHQQLLQQGAVFGELAGWERPAWFTHSAIANREYTQTWRRPHWFDNVAQEVAALRSGVGVYDMSSFGKVQVAGPDAERYLNWLCANQLSVPIGQLVYTQMLNQRGGVVADVTVTRLQQDLYLVVTPAAMLVENLAWLQRWQTSYQVTLTDVTAAESVLAVMGPGSRALLAELSPHNFDNQHHPFGQAQDIEFGMAIARAHRMSYVGELGWEIFVSSDMAHHALQVLLDVGASHELVLCGTHAMDCGRLEKGFRHAGHDITSADHVLEAGLGFAVQTNKPEFLGRDAVLHKREQGLKRRLVQFLLQDPEPLLFHNEPIWRDGQLVGHLTSGGFGHWLGAAVGLGYVPCSQGTASATAAELMSSSYEIDVAGKRYPATASLKPLYDPKGMRPKSG